MWAHIIVGVSCLFAGFLLAAVCQVSAQAAERWEERKQDRIYKE